MGRLGDNGIPGDSGGWISGGCSDSVLGMVERVLTLHHLPERPSWNCVADGEEWPCMVARVTLKLHMQDGPLRVAMAAFVHEAVATDLRLSGVVYDRFYGWTYGDRAVNSLVRAVGQAPVPRPQPPRG